MMTSTNTSELRPPTNVITMLNWKQGFGVFASAYAECGLVLGRRMAIVGQYSDVLG